MNSELPQPKSSNAPGTRKSTMNNVIKIDDDSDVLVVIHVKPPTTPKMEEGTSQSPSKKALDRVAARLVTAQTDFLMLCRVRGTIPTSTELKIRGFLPDFAFEPLNKHPVVPFSALQDGSTLVSAEDAFELVTNGYIKQAVSKKTKCSQRSSKNEEKQKRH
ncbi:hypothetical protein L873DRAFT_1847246 [Choiromyces venosus 120613-1]|uniref:Uncharacterized protein n=1 Tax=Choiromyces venosus 120613-1 TaxID=1336337 RepID=A0A3N4JHL6_9PEZI|nr:hypothetical protein L873DRAFT_1847246 [Choiromyces venosus 120613-1]